MKRRLNILCVIVMLVLCYSVAESLYYMGIGARTGIEAAREMKTCNKPGQHTKYRDLALSDMVVITTLVPGLTAMIVAEVFSIGLKMKEEQDLTI